MLVSDEHLSVEILENDIASRHMGAIELHRALLSHVPTRNLPGMDVGLWIGPVDRMCFSCLVDYRSATFAQWRSGRRNTSAWSLNLLYLPRFAGFRCASLHSLVVANIVSIVLLVGETGLPFSPIRSPSCDLACTLCEVRNEEALIHIHFKFPPSRCRVTQFRNLDSYPLPLLPATRSLYSH